MAFDYSYTSFVLSALCLVFLIGILTAVALIIVAPVEIASIVRRILTAVGCIFFMALGYAIVRSVQNNCSSESQCTILIGVTTLSGLGVIGLIEFWVSDKKARGEWSVSRDKMFMEMSQLCQNLVP